MKKRILILGYDEFILSIMEDLFTYEDYDVKTLNNSHTVIQSIQQFLPDVVLVDNPLDDVKGNEICHLIKSNPLTSKIPVIVISAYPRVFNPSEKYDYDSFIAKPFDLDFLLKTIDDCIQSHISG